MSCRGGFDRLGWVAVVLSLLVVAWPATVRAQAAPPAAPAQAAPPPAAPPPAPYAPPGYAPPPGYYPPPGGYPGWGAPPAPRWVNVDLRSDDPRVRIDRVVGESRVPICFAPCRKMLDTGSVYVIGGDGVRTTRNFVLPDDRNAVTLDVQAGSTARFATGVILVGAGVVVAYIGSLVWEIGTLGDFESTSHSNTARTGGTMVLIGIPAALIGLYLTITTHTSVTSSTGSSFTLDTPSPPRHRPWIALTPRGLEF